MTKRINEPDLITRSYIHRQLSRNKAARDLERDFIDFCSKHPHIPEHSQALAFLNDQGLPSVSFFTFNTEDVYAEHSLFFFTHAAYYEYTQLLRRNYIRMEDMESYFISMNLDFSTRLKATEQRLQDILEELAFELREDPHKIWKEPAYVFVYHYFVESLPVDNLNAYRFFGVGATVPTKICYIP